MSETTTPTDRHVRAYADLFIAKFSSIAGDYRNPWLPTLPFTSQNAAGHLYSGVNDVNLSLACALRGFRTPVWLTASQCRDLGVLRLAGETGSPVYWGGTVFLDSRTGAVDAGMRWAEYRTLPDEEKSRYRLRFSPGSRSFVWNLEQTDFPGRHPDAWENIRAQFQTPPRREASEARLDALLESGAWRPDGSHGCRIFQTDTSEARYERASRYIEIPRKELYSDQRNFYDTLLHLLSHSAIVEHAAADYRGDGDPLADQARLHLSSELAAAVLAGRLGLSQTLSPTSLQYLKGWTQVLSDDPAVILEATRDSRNAVQAVGDCLGLTPREAPDLCRGLVPAQGQVLRPRCRTVEDSLNGRTGRPYVHRSPRHRP